MPINNITQSVSIIPAPPHRGVDVQTVFVTKQEDFQDHLAGTTIDELNTFKDQLNLRIGEINSTVTTMNGYADTASAGASTATTKAGEASASASEALTSRNQASTFASDSSYFETRARKWADNNYNVAVEAGKYSAKHWATEAQNATSGKIDKVTSTDNAIVRFDGTTGAVQNSGVIIDDNGNVGIGFPTPTSKLHVQGNIRTGCSGFDVVNTRGIIFDIDGNTHGRLAVDNNNSLLYIGSGGMGYGTGSGGAVTQLTSKSTAVTLNKPCGQIVTSNMALGSGVTARFILRNSLLTGNDTLKVIVGGYGAGGAYQADCTYCVNGEASIAIKNLDAVSRTDAVAINFIVIKGAIS